MEILTGLKCPYCGGMDLQLVSKIRRGGAGNPTPYSPPSTLSVYRCRCGTQFTDTVYHHQEQQERPK